MSAQRKWLDRRQPEPVSNAYGPIGIYFTRQNLHIVQLEKFADGNIDICSHSSLAYPGSRADLMASPAAVRKLLRRAIRGGKFHGRKVVSAMPPEQVRVMSVSYPASANSNAASSIAKLMADRVDGPLTDYVVDYVPIRMNSHDGDRLALVAVSRLEHANNYLDTLESAGLHVDLLEIGPMAINRLISSGTTANLQNQVFMLKVGYTSTSLTTISGERLLADQELEFGEQRILSAIANSLDLTENMAKDLILKNGLDLTKKTVQISETGSSTFDTSTVATLVEIVRPEFLRLSRDIERAFLFADSESHGNSQKKIIVAGDIAQWPGAAKLLGSLTNTPVECLGRSHMPFAESSGNHVDISDQAAAEMSTAVGLALRGLASEESH